MEDIKNMYNVSYSGGESRYTPGKAIDYMIVDVDGDELYAEADVIDDDETGTYDSLKDEILKQADEIGIPRSELKFFYDD